MKLKIGDKIRERVWDVRLQQYRLSNAIYVVIGISPFGITASDNGVKVELLTKNCRKVS